MKTVTRFPDPLNAPFGVGDRVRYTGPAFQLQDSRGRFSLNPGARGECIMITTGRRGGVLLGYDEDTGEPDYSQTVHDRSTVRFADGYEAMVDAETDRFELVEAAPIDSL